MNRQWLLHERPVGMIGPEHFNYVETDIPEPGDGEVLIRNLMFSFDPTQRGWTMDRESYLPPVQIGEPMRAGCVAQVVKSNHPDFSAGQMVQATNGWQDYAVVDPAHPPSSLAGCEGSGCAGSTRRPPRGGVRAARRGSRLRHAPCAALERGAMSAEVDGRCVHRHSGLSP